jgi:hypothetical protein
MCPRTILPSLPTPCEILLDLGLWRDQFRVLIATLISRSYLACPPRATLARVRTVCARATAQDAVRERVCTRCAPVRLSQLAVRG